MHRRDQAVAGAGHDDRPRSHIGERGRTTPRLPTRARTRRPAAGSRWRSAPQREAPGARPCGGDAGVIARRGAAARCVLGSSRGRRRPRRPPRRTAARFDNARPRRPAASSIARRACRGTSITRRSRTIRQRASETSCGEGVDRQRLRAAATSAVDGDRSCRERQLSATGGPAAPARSTADSRVVRASCAPAGEDRAADDPAARRDRVHARTALHGPAVLPPVLRAHYTRRAVRRSTAIRAAALHGARRRHRGAARAPPPAAPAARGDRRRPRPRRSRCACSSRARARATSASACCRCGPTSRPTRCPTTIPSALERRVRVDYPVRIDRADRRAARRRRCASSARSARPGASARWEKLLVWSHWLWFRVPARDRRCTCCCATASASRAARR